MAACLLSSRRRSRSWPLLQNASMPETHGGWPVPNARLHVSQNRLTGLLVAVKRLQAAQQTGNVVPRLLVDLKLLVEHETVEDFSQMWFS